MNFAKRAWMFVGFIMFAAALVTALAPKAAHALIATLVQVTNTSANPVPNKDVDNPDRSTVVDLYCVAPGLAGFTAVGCDTTSSFTVPAGQRLILEQLDAQCVTPEGNALYGANMNFTGAGTGYLHPFALGSPATHSGVTNYVQNQTIRYYVDSGSPIYFDLSTTDTSGSTNCSFQVVGHLISYP
jgi:hypothetical protein